jgi:mRNA interferase MazF
MFAKRFLEWIGVKRKLDAHDYQPPLVREGELWWCAVGENVGIEASGKGENFTRPVIVLKRFGTLAFFGIPMTMTRREGSWYVSIRQRGVTQTAMLMQARTFSYKRLHRKMGELDKTDLRNVKEAFVRLFS